MDTTDRECERLDTEFLTMLSDSEMQHFWTKLPHRADRDRCVMWITKFREPQEGLHAKRNRNEYMQLMKRMLRKGIVEAPFTHTPQPGLLPVLPAFMSVLYNDYNSIFNVHNQSNWGPSAASGTSSARSLYPLQLNFNEKHEKQDPTNSFGLCTAKDGGDIPRSVYRDASYHKSDDREAEIRSKIFEERWQEERLRMEQKHQAKEQQILYRKNAEIEELKGRYHVERTEQEEALKKVKREMEVLKKELASVKENTDKQLEEMRRATQQSSQSREAEIEQRVYEVTARYEQEKLNMRKEQKHNMEKHMNETKQKLCEMEEKYNKKIEATSALICGLEDRVQQLMADADSSTRQRYDLENQRAALEGQVERLQADFQDIQAKHTVSKLRDEILQANQIRKQQFVELSVLKEEEKQKTQKEHEEQMTTLKSQYEEKLKSSIPVSVPQTLESMISILQDQVSSLKHHNTVLVQLLQLNKDLSPYLPTLSSSATLSNVHDFELSVHAANSTKVTALHTTKPLESTKSPVHGTNGKTSTKHISSDDCAWNATDNDVYELTVMRKMRKTVMMRIMMRRKKRKRKQRSRS